MCKNECHSRLEAFLSWDDVATVELLDRWFHFLCPRSLQLYFLSILFLCLMCCLGCRANQQQNGANKKVNFREKEKQILDKILGPAHYDRRIRPSAANGTGFLIFWIPYYIVCLLRFSFLVLTFCIYLLCVQTDGPTIVDINLMFRGISDISDNKMVNNFCIYWTWRFGLLICWVWYCKSKPT